MLHREHSDFQWFKERTQSLHSKSISEYSAMATTAEPSLPGERAEHALPPKSYADAVVSGNDTKGNAQDRRPSVSGASSATAVDDTASRSQVDEDKLVYEKYTGTNGGGRLTSVRPDISYEQSLRHNDTTTPRERKKTAANRPQFPLESGRTAGAGWQRSA